MSKNSGAEGLDIWITPPCAAEQQFFPIAQKSTTASWVLLSSK